ncbi:butyrophilin-like protein 2 [Colossoma macropomum]|uniref:butyrophilin-like protein 2 n=1 Tax=Colossoma macropomum TaxID=42526 RepID=UPI001864844C|nr:butyrophilin-like protein 2 [Colossoma macropomum]
MFALLSGLHVLGPAGPLIAKLGGSVMLPCYVEAPLPLEELDAEWKRTDSETLVHLFQDGKSRLEFQDQAYSGRASFFTEEVARGNFSLLLTNLTTKDAGVYNCFVYSQQETGQTSVEIEYLVVTGGHAVSAYEREDVTLNCSVDSYIPPQELEEVSWTKVDQDITMLVLQEGVIQTDFTPSRFRNRVEFFGPEEIHKGNFSFSLKDLRMEDKGQYRCEVLSGEFSAQTTVEIHLIKNITHLAVFALLSGLRVLGPSDPLIVELGGSVMLPCYVEAPIPLEELKVEWKRTDSETLVHLFQDGESRPEAQDQAYSGRASFFTEEVKHGNFSLLLTNLTTKDAGVYNCSVYRQQETGQTLVDIEYLIVTGGHAVSAYAREDVTLNCSVDSHIPPKELEKVSWKKVDQDITVLVFQEGEVQTDFTHERFRDRVEFFGPEEIHKGNFSLRIKTLQMEDKGLYRCEVLSGEFSAHTTVEILLGKLTCFSHIHTAILLLCGFTCLCGCVLLLGCITYTFCKEPGSCTEIVQRVLVFCPNILMFVAFVLWGVLNEL